MIDQLDYYHERKRRPTLRPPNLCSPWSPNLVMCDTGDTCQSRGDFMTSDTHDRHTEQQRGSPLHCSSSTLALFYSCYQYSSITFARHFLTLFISFALAKRVHVSIILLFAPRIVSFFTNKFYCISLMEQELSTNPSGLYRESPCYIVWCKILINDTYL